MSVRSSLSTGLTAGLAAGLVAGAAGFAGVSPVAAAPMPVLASPAVQLSAVVASLPLPAAAAPTPPAPVIPSAGGSIGNAIINTYNAIEPWAQYGVELGAWAVGWLPWPIGLIAPQMNIAYNSIEPVVGASVYSFAYLLDGQFDLIGPTLVNGVQTAVNNFVQGELSWIASFFPPLPPIPFPPLPGAAVQPVTSATSVAPVAVTPDAPAVDTPAADTPAATEPAATEPAATEQPAEPVAPVERPARRATARGQQTTPVAAAAVAAAAAETAPAPVAATGSADVAPAGEAPAADTADGPAAPASTARHHTRGAAKDTSPRAAGGTKAGRPGRS